MLLFILVGLGCGVEQNKESEPCTRTDGEVRICLRDESGTGIRGYQAYAKQGEETPIYAYLDADDCVTMTLPVGTWDVGLDMSGCVYAGETVEVGACALVETEVVVEFPCVGLR